MSIVVVSYKCGTTWNFSTVAFAKLRKTFQCFSYNHLMNNNSKNKACAYKVYKLAQVQMKLIYPLIAVPS